MELLVDSDIPGKYSLHPQSEEKLAELGYILKGEIGNDLSPSTIKGDLKLHQLDDDFFEVEDILDCHLCKNTLSYEYKVRFKGYGPADDMWYLLLP